MKNIILLLASIVVLSSCSLVHPYGSHSKCDANLNGTPFHDLLLVLEEDLVIDREDLKIKATLPKGVYFPHSQAGKCKYLLYTPQQITIDIDSKGFWNKIFGNRSNSYRGGLFFTPEESNNIHGFWYYQTGSNAGYNSYSFDNEIKYKFVKRSEF